MAEVHDQRMITGPSFCCEHAYDSIRPGRKPDRPIAGVDHLRLAAAEAPMRATAATVRADPHDTVVKHHDKPSSASWVGTFPSVNGALSWSKAARLPRTTRTSLRLQLLMEGNRAR